MSWNRWLVVALFPLISLSGCKASGDEPGYIVTPGMVASVPWDPYEPNKLTPSGHTLMSPPEGTLPVGFMPHVYGVAPAETARAGRDLRNQVPQSPEALARGRWVYDTYCGVCHGPGGEGDGPVVGPGRFPNPASLVAPHARDLADGSIYHIITVGQGLMPSHAVQIAPMDRWCAVRYVRKLQTVSTDGDKP